MDGPNEEAGLGTGGHSEESARRAEGKKRGAENLEEEALPARLELATCGLEIRCSIQLSYGSVAVGLFGRRGVGPL